MKDNLLMVSSTDTAARLTRMARRSKVPSCPESVRGSSLGLMLLDCREVSVRAKRWPGCANRCQWTSAKGKLLFYDECHSVVCD